MQTKIYPSKLCGQYIPVQSKSMMHRALICGSFCTTESSIIKPLLSDDIQKTMQILQDLGINIKINNELLTITPVQSINLVSHPLDCGDSATTLRMLAPIIAYFAPGVKFLISNQLKRRIKNEDFAFLDLDFEISDTDMEVMLKWR